MNTRPVLELDCLSISYETEKGWLDSVRAVSLRVQPHEKYGLVGESGSGKSTLALGIMRYLAGNGRVRSGRVLMNGVDLLALPEMEMRKSWGGQIGMVYQNPSTALNPALVIGDQIAEMARIHLKMSQRDAWDRAIEMLGKVRMPDPASVARRYPHQLSGGMLQRVLIAMALTSNPQLLIMDEPTTALDVTTEAVVLDLIQSLTQEFGSAILYITHNLGVVARLCDRVGVMYAGELMEEGPVRDLFRLPIHPYTQGLIDCAPRVDTSKQQGELNTIPGYIPRLDELPRGCTFAPRCSLTVEACTQSRPPLVEIAPGRSTACLRWRELSASSRQPSAEKGEADAATQGHGDAAISEGVGQGFIPCRPVGPPLPLGEGRGEGAVDAPPAPPPPPFGRPLPLGEAVTTSPRGEGTHDPSLITHHSPTQNPVRPLLEAIGIKKYFRSGGLNLPGIAPAPPVKAVDGITVQIPRGLTLGLVGESGCGKTTFGRSIVGLVEPSEGEVRLEGDALAPAVARRTHSVLKRIQMVFQNPDASLNPRMTVGEILGRPLIRLARMSRKESRRRIVELLGAVHLPESYMDRLPEELSGGEKQRVAIARAFAASPDLVICDEPVSALDVSVQGALLNLLGELQRTEGTTYLFISHDLAAVRHLADQIGVIYLGRLWELGDSDEVFAPPYHPYTEALLSAVPVPDPDVKQKRIRLEGTVPSAIRVPAGCRFHTRCPRKIGPICETDEPAWKIISATHKICCHIPIEELVRLQSAVIEGQVDGEATGNRPQATGNELAEKVEGFPPSPRPPVSPSLRSPVRPSPAEGGQDA